MPFKDYHKPLLYGVIPVTFFLCAGYLTYQLLTLPIFYYIAVLGLSYLAWTKCSPRPPPISFHPQSYNAVVVGAGFSGLCIGARLKEAGVPFTILESAPGLGGTWLHNSYPGCACDVWTTLYQFSFFQNPNWSRYVAPAAEIKEYLADFARTYGLDGAIRFNTRVEATEWDDEKSVWNVETDKGSFTARFLISACGALHKPLMPEIAGMGRFKGDSFHSALWNHEVSLDGKSVAVVGSAASAVQIVPAIAGKVKKLYVFQRTPNWFFPKLDPVYPEFVKRLFRWFPFLMTLQRSLLFVWVEIWAMVWLRKGWMSTLFQKFITSSQLRQVEGDQELERKVIPQFSIGCKRVLLTDDFLPTFRNNSHCHLVTDPIEEITEDGVKTTGGERKVDVIVYATGFDIEGSICAFKAEGRHGKDLREQIDSHPVAYHGITMPNFPNFFFLLGPNTVLAHNSVVFMIECQVNYVLDIIHKMNKLRMRNLEPRKDVTEEYERKMGTWTKTKNFSDTCRGWYRNKDGVNFALWPKDLFSYWRMTREADILNHYKVAFEEEYFDQ